MIKRHPDMPGGAFTGRFYVVNDKTGLAIQADATRASAENSVRELHEHEGRCEERRKADHTIPRRERESYHIEEEVSC
jgi:hypothetical protein